MSTPKIFDFGRRTFLQGTTALAAVSLFPHKLRTSANEKLRTVHIGVGGMGNSDLGSIASHSGVEIAGLCDVDKNALGKAHEQFGNARTFVDFREMLSELGDSIDAVVVSTPDHTHAPAAMMAMGMDKHVYCQKPLTHEVYEARQLRLMAEEKELVTQMGIQVHSSAVYRRAVLMIQQGVVGKVSQVHAWSNKNWGYDGGAFTTTAEAPAHLNWDLWLGTAKARDFSPRVYHPGQWRKLIDFGTGTLGDMGVHIFDSPYAALKLTAPNWVSTSCREPTSVGHPEQNKVEYEFPGTDYTTEKLMWTWYDGKMAPPKSTDVGLGEDVKLPGQGSLFVGEKGTMLLPHVGEAVLYPSADFEGFDRPQVDERNHYHEWVDACMGEGETSASFDYGGPLTEALLLGVVANRFPGEKLTWDAGKMETNNSNANELLRRRYRKGFEVQNL